LRATRKHLEDSVVLQSSPVPKAPEQTARVDAAAPIAPSRLVGALGDKRLLSVASVLVVLAIWQWGAGHVSGFLLPAPADVLARFALVFLMCVFDVLVIMIAGARDVRTSLIDVGRAFCASHGTRLRLIVLPALLPFLFAALRVGSARAINGMITAELFFAAVN